MTTAPPSAPVLTHPDLLARLQSWCPDPPTARVTFVQQLARDNGWSVDHACRVVVEYRRFLYLAVTAGHLVCPSEAIDQAWHQHLLDTRAYWEEFCPRVLGQPLHHAPSKGREGEEPLLREGYRRTLASYRVAFGEAPPSDLWPPVERRFGGAGRWRGVDARRHWILPRLGRWSPVALLSLALAGCGAGAKPFPLSLSGPAFLLFYGLLTAASLLLVTKLSQIGRAHV